MAVKPITAKRTRARTCIHGFMDWMWQPIKAVPVSRELKTWRGQNWQVLVFLVEQQHAILSVQPTVLHDTMWECCVVQLKYCFHLNLFQLVWTAKTPNPQQPEAIYWTWLDELQSSIHKKTFVNDTFSPHSNTLIINELHLEFDFVDSTCHVFFICPYCLVLVFVRTWARHLILQCLQSTHCNVTQMFEYTVSMFKKCLEYRWPFFLFFFFRKHYTYSGLCCVFPLYETALRCLFVVGFGWRMRSSVKVVLLLGFVFVNVKTVFKLL